MAESGGIPWKNELAIRGLYGLRYGAAEPGRPWGCEGREGWAMDYVDDGCAWLGEGETALRLDQGQLCIHRADARGSLRGGADGARLLCMVLACQSPAMRDLSGKVFTLGLTQRRLLMRALAEARRAWGAGWGESPRRLPRPLPDAPRGSGQMMVLTITQLLLELLRTIDPGHKQAQRPGLAGEEDFAASFERARALMCGQLDGTLRFATVCRGVGQSATVFKERFRRYTGVTVMDYYRRLRVEEAQRRLRAGEKNVTQIADELGYSSVAAFSRQFKRLTRLTPGAYLRSVAP